MRTTLTLDDEVAERLRVLAHERRAPFKQVVNEALRAGLAGLCAEPESAPYRVQTFAGTFRPGVDPARLNQLADDLEVEEGGDLPAEEPA
jgi:hypothetical protein